MYNKHPKTVSRGAQLAQIHIAKKELGMDDDTYRAFLMLHTGKASSAKLEMHERFKLIKAFENAGWKPKKKKPRKQNIPGRKPSYTERQSRYMIVLWGKLFDQGKIQNQDQSGGKLTSNEAMERWIAGVINKPGQQLPMKINPDNLAGSERGQLTEQLKRWVDRA